MTSHKDLKRLVRARMRKTGEAYTAARAHITKKQQPPPSVAPATASPAIATTPLVVPTPKDYPALAGMSDAALKAKTGCTWERWVRSLDHHHADQMTHREIATLVAEKYKVAGWWAQNVAVGYERIKGLRGRGQQRDGSYEATRSRTFNVPVATLYAAWADRKLRRRWLTGAVTKVRTSTAPKSMRLDWTDGTDHGIVAVGFTAKGASKSAVALSQSRLPDRESANKRKQYWSDCLDALADLLDAVS